MNTAVLRVYKSYVGIYFTRMYLNQIYEQSLKFHHIVNLYQTSAALIIYLEHNNNNNKMTTAVLLALFTGQFKQGWNTHNLNMASE